MKRERKVKRVNQVILDKTEEENQVLPVIQDLSVQRVKKVSKVLLALRVREE